MKEEKMKLPKITLDDFFTTQEERDDQKLEKVQVISINEITSFPNHPYKVRDDEEMISMAETVKQLGVIHPIIVRPKQNGGYEMISGHRRKRACEIAGVTQIKAIVREMTDEEATIAMVNSNNQRENVLPSEKAFAYKMKLEAEKHQGQRNDLTSTTDVSKLRSDEKIGEEIGTSRETIRKYIRLTELIPELLQFVDNQYLKIKDKIQMSLTPAVEISYLSKNEQEILLEAMEEILVTPSTPQAKRLREESEKGNLTEDKIYEVLDEEKPNQKEQVKVPDDELQPYYPKDVVSTEQKRKYIVHCVRKVSELEKNLKQKKMEYAR